MENGNYTPEPTADKIDLTKSETSDTKKKDKPPVKKEAAQRLGETLFKAEEPAATKTETFWERIGFEKEGAEDEAETAVDDAQVLHGAINEHITDRQDEIRAELAQVDPNTAEAVAVASDAALLEHAHEQFAQAEPVAQPEAALDTAYAQTSEEIDEAIHTLEAETGASEGGAGEPPETPPPAGESAPAEEPEPTPAPVYSSPRPLTPAEAWRATEPVLTANQTTERDAQLRAAEAYRRGRSGGLLTGGVLGFLYGRRRGRIKTEKRLKPALERVENQLKQVTNKLTRREQGIRTLATQKVEQAPQPIRYDKIAERLKPNIPEQRPVPLAETMPPPPRAPEVAPIAEMLPPNQPEVEAPVAATAAELALSRSEYAGIVPFNTSEQMSGQELKAIAEKVIIDHVSLKDMYEAQQFDEKGLRRIVNEFLRGGDVQRAITNEVIRKDKAFELDPRLRRQQTNDAAKGGGATGTIDGQYKELPSAGEPSRAQQLREQTKRLPELGQAAMRDLKKRQLISVAAVTVVVIIAILLALWATS